MIVKGNTCSLQTNRNPSKKKLTERYDNLFPGGIIKNETIVLLEYYVKIGDLKNNEFIGILMLTYRMATKT